MIVRLRADTAGWPSVATLKWSETEKLPVSLVGRPGGDGYGCGAAEQDNQQERHSSFYLDNHSSSFVGIVIAIQGTKSP